MVERQWPQGSYHTSTNQGLKKMQEKSKTCFQVIIIRIEGSCNVDVEESYMNRTIFLFLFLFFILSVFFLHQNNSTKYHPPLFHHRTLYYGQMLFVCFVGFFECEQKYGRSSNIVRSSRFHGEKRDQFYFLQKSLVEV